MSRPDSEFIRMAHEIRMDLLCAMTKDEYVTVAREASTVAVELANRLKERNKELEEIKKNGK